MKQDFYLICIIIVSIFLLTAGCTQRSSSSISTQSITPTITQQQTPMVKSTSNNNVNPNIITDADACSKRCDYPEFCEKTRNSKCFGDEWWNTGERNVFYCQQLGGAPSAMKFNFVASNHVIYKDIVLNYTTWTD
jgi:hypothetical protein